MAVSIEMRKPAVADNRNMRRRIGAGLLVAAASVTLAGVALQVSGGSKTVTQQGPTAAQRMAFVLEEHGYNLTQAPTAEQRIAFVLEEHGYSADQQLAFLQDAHQISADRAAIAEQRADKPSIAEPRTEFLQDQQALTPTTEQRIAFVLEEHGYNLAELSSPWNKGYKPN